MHLGAIALSNLALTHRSELARISFGDPEPPASVPGPSNALLNLLEVGPDPVTPAEGGKTLTFSAVSSLFLAAGALNSSSSNRTFNPSKTQ
jgi:hypothetical protein